MLFKTFSRKVVVVVPSEEDWKQRLEWRKEVEGDDVPESIMLEMKGGRKMYQSGTCPWSAHSSLGSEPWRDSPHLKCKPGE